MNSPENPQCRKAAVGWVLDRLGYPKPAASAQPSSPPPEVKTALALLRQAALAIEKVRSTRLDGPLMSVLDACDELEKACNGTGKQPQPEPQGKRGAVCVCGHSDHWHGNHGRGSCEASPDLSLIHISEPTRP